MLVEHHSRDWRTFFRTIMNIAVVGDPSLEGNQPPPDHPVRTPMPQTCRGKSRGIVYN
jgi:hypothetical protein